MAYTGSRAQNRHQRGESPMGPPTLDRRECELVDLMAGLALGADELDEEEEAGVLALQDRAQRYLKAQEREATR